MRNVIDRIVHYYDGLVQVVEGQVVCPYHGWEFNGDGHCVKMPSTPHCRNVGVSALPCAEKDGFIWVWPGDGLPAEVGIIARACCAWRAVASRALLVRC
jgi:phenylpropionate dioxygenase-like ring-hydroxylating dioxygenase large terminal subunit